MMAFPTRLGFGARMPVILQVEQAECGLACLAMIASHHRLHTDLATLRGKFSVSMRGATLKILMEMGKALGMTPRPLKLDMEHLKDLRLPCILHWDMNHFVVLKELRRGKAIVHDPAIGERVLDLDEVAKHFTGVALELTPSSEFKPAVEERKFTLMQLMGRVSGLGKSLAQVFILALALEIVAIVAPLYMQWVVDHALVSSDRSLLTVLGVGFIFLVIVQSCISAFRSWAVVVMGTNLNVQWQSNVFGHLLRLPIDYFEKRHLGDIVSRFGSIGTIQRTLTLSFVQAVVDGLLVIGTLAMLVIYSKLLAFIAVCAVVVYCVARALMFRSLKSATAEQIVHAAKQQTHFLETARGVQSVRLFGRSDARRVSWSNLLVEQFNADIRIQRLGISYQTINTFLFGIERVALIWLAALAVLNREFSVGMMLAFIAYKDQFSSRMVALVDRVFEWKMLRLHGERVADIVLSEPENEGDGTFTDTTHLQASLELNNVSFRYSPLEPYVLRNVSLSIPAGQSIAITGASGTGKTTLVKVLLGLLTPTEGEVRVGGVPVTQVGMGAYRQMVGAVMQDDTLFTGSVAENICFFDPQPDQARIEQCAKLAQCFNEIMSMPMGLNTFIGDIGSGMSGGQKQRILLARALYKQPRILILDEATSHLDIMNERAVSEAIKGLDLTRILIAHRPETINTAERVVVMHQGQIARDMPVPKPAAPVSPAATDETVQAPASPASQNGSSNA